MTVQRTPAQSRSPGVSTAGQANLVALVAALVALTAVTVFGVAFAESALLGEDRRAVERHVATTLSERLVSASSPLTRRPNVLDSGALDRLTVEDLRRGFPLLDGRAVELRLDSTVLASDGTPAGGTTIRRIVLVETTQRQTLRPAFSAGNVLTLPRRTANLTVDLTPPSNVSVTAVRANERVILRDPGGLRGRYRVSVPRRETVTLAFRANDSLARGDVQVRTFPARTRKAQLVVTVDA